MLGRVAGKMMDIEVSGYFGSDGEMAKLIDAYDWASTELGPLEAWPVPVKTAVGLILASSVPMVTLWGASRTVIYNDAYAALVTSGDRTIFGRASDEGIIHIPGSSRLNYSPIIDESGTAVGVIGIVVESAHQVAMERELRESEARLRFLDKLGRTTANSREPEQVMAVTTQMLGQFLGVSICAYADMEADEDHFTIRGDWSDQASPSIVGYYSLADFGALAVKNLGDGLPLIINDNFTEIAPAEAATFQSIGITATICMPLVKQGRLTALMAIHDKQARIWTERELALLREVTERSWAHIERVRSDAESRASGAQFQTFAQAMPNHVWTAPPDGMLDWFNARVYDYSGATPGELDGERWAKLVHLDDLGQAVAGWTASLASGEPYEAEFRLRRHDGNYRWHIARAVPIKDGSGAVTRWIGTNTDIDDQKRAQEALAESEARLNLAIEAGQLAVWDLNLETMHVTPSVALNRIYGFADDFEPTAADYRSRYAPGEAERLDKAGAEAAARGETELEVEVLHILPGGHKKWLLIRAQAVAGGKRVLGVVIDVTRRKQIEEELSASERRFRLSQNAAGIASLELDIPTGNVIGSDTFWSLWGLSQRDFVHISVLEDIVIPEDAEVRSTASTRKAGTANPDVEYRIRRPDTGELRWLARNIEFTYDADGHPLKMFGIMQDITERKEAQARQELLTHELEHRIKNILAMVSAIASQTLRNTDLDAGREALNERLKALATAHDILTKTRWTNASLLHVVRAAVAPFSALQIVADGPLVALTPKMALSLALAVNELATNSLKYGALSTEVGQVRVDWSFQGDGQERVLNWHWREVGGPTVVAPKRRGFGTFLVERVLAADFGGTVRIDYPPDGVKCTLVAPMADHQRQTDLESL